MYCSALQMMFSSSLVSVTWRDIAMLRSLRPIFYHIYTVCQGRKASIIALLPYLRASLYARSSSCDDRSTLLHALSGSFGSLNVPYTDMKLRNELMLRSVHNDRFASNQYSYSSCKSGPSSIFTLRLVPMFHYLQSYGYQAYPWCYPFVSLSRSYWSSLK